MKKTLLTSLLAATSVSAGGLIACSTARPTSDAAREAAAVVSGSPITSGLAGKCLDDSGDRTADYNKIQLWDCNGTSAQDWSFIGGALVGPGGKCIDVHWGDQTAGTKVDLFDCNGTSAQQWTVAGTQIKSSGGLCLDAEGVVNADGTQVQIWPCNGGLNQVWNLAAPGGGSSSGSSGGGGSGGGSSSGSGGPGGTGSGGSSSGGGSGSSSGGGSGGGSSSGGSCTPAFGSVGPYDVTPPVCWEPYGSASTWSTPINDPDDPGFCTKNCDPNDAAKVGWMKTIGGGGEQDVGIYPYSGFYNEHRGYGGFPYYWAKTTDPKINIVCTAGYGPGGSNDCPIPSSSNSIDGKSFVYIPAGAQESWDVDHHIVVFQPDGSEWEAWEFANGQAGYVQGWDNPGEQSPPWTDGETIYASWGGYESAAVVAGTGQPGSGWESGTEGGNFTAGGNNGFAGQVTLSELQAASIRHALTWSTPCSQPGSGPAVVLPASGFGQTEACSLAGVAPPSSDAANIPLGARLWIDTADATIDGIPGMSALGKAFLHTMHDYGAYLMDFGGNTWSPRFTDQGADQAGWILGGKGTAGDSHAAVGVWASTTSGLPKSTVNSDANFSTYMYMSEADFQTYFVNHMHILKPCSSALGCAY